MEYLNRECIEGLSAEAFQKQHPYPWVNIQATLTPQGYQRLRETLPDVSLFDRKVGVKRALRPGLSRPRDPALQAGPEVARAVEGLPRGAAWKDLRLLSPPHARRPIQQAIDPQYGVVLRLAGLFRLAALRRAAQAGHPHLLFQHGGRIGTQTGAAIS